MLSHSFLLATGSMQVISGYISYTSLHHYISAISQMPLDLIEVIITEETFGEQVPTIPTGTNGLNTELERDLFVYRRMHFMNGWIVQVQVSVPDGSVLWQKNKSNYIAIYVYDINWYFLHDFIIHLNHLTVISNKCQYIPIQVLNTTGGVKL